MNNYKNHVLEGENTIITHISNDRTPSTYKIYK